jgi:hypothetical protein
MTPTTKNKEVCQENNKLENCKCVETMESSGLVYPLHIYWDITITRKDVCVEQITKRIMLVEFETVVNIFVFKLLTD